MRRTVSLIAIVLWLLGLLASLTWGGLLHLLLLVPAAMAILAVARRRSAGRYTAAKQEVPK